MLKIVARSLRGLEINFENRKKIRHNVLVKFTVLGYFKLD